MFLTRNYSGNCLREKRVLGILQNRDFRETGGLFFNWTTNPFVKLFSVHTDSKHLPLSKFTAAFLHQKLQQPIVYHHFLSKMPTTQCSCHPTLIGKFFTPPKDFCRNQVFITNSCSPGNQCAYTSSMNRAQIRGTKIELGDWDIP